MNRSFAAETRLWESFGGFSTAAIMSRDFVADGQSSVIVFLKAQKAEKQSVERQTGIAAKERKKETANGLAVVPLTRLCYQLES